MKMEGKEEVSGSSLSFTSELFGSKINSGSSSSFGIFSSIFSPSSNKPFGKESVVCSEVGAKNQEIFGTKFADQDTISRDKEDELKGPPIMENNLFYQEQKVRQPCHLSSSIYYGGQDDYNSPKTTQSSSYPVYNKDGAEDEGFASRGNWWQGSV